MQSSGKYVIHTAIEKYTSVRFLYFFSGRNDSISNEETKPEKEVPSLKCGVRLYNYSRQKGDIEEGVKFVKMRKWKRRG